MCLRYADRNPEHTWINTRKGHRIWEEAVAQVFLRDPDEFGVYIYNRWNSYAICEVLENLVRTSLVFDDASVLIWSLARSL